jgi:hypothetical protein
LHPEKFEVKLDGDKPIKKATKKGKKDGDEDDFKI